MSFTKFDISTTTVTTTLWNGIGNGTLNIIDIAKYLPLDDSIVALKLLYAGSSFAVLRGIAKLSSKKKKYFLNQVTITLRFGKMNMIVSCKIFHNGTIHITGTHNLDEALEVYNIIYSKLKKLSGLKFIKIQPDLMYLCSMDNLIYNHQGDIVGWKTDSKIVVSNEEVQIHFYNDKQYFFSSVWKQNKKNIYSLEGKKVGWKELVFDTFKYIKKYYKVEYGLIYFKNQIIGKEKVYLQESVDYDKMNFFIQQKFVLHSFDYKTIETDKTRESFNIHMINGYFKAPFQLSKLKLHNKLLEDGYYSRFDSCSSSSVNLRYHLDPNNGENKGICLYENKATCLCKDISISFFASGKINVTGLSNMDQTSVLYNFICKLLDDIKLDIIV